MFIINNLEPCRAYTAVISVINSLDEITAEDNVTFSELHIACKYIIFLLATYNIQHVMIMNEDNGSVSVQCVFVSGSTADGCHVIFTDINQGIVESFNITEATQITLLTSGNYTVTIYDIVNENIINLSCVQPKLVKVIKFSSVHTSTGMKTIIILIIYNVIFYSQSSITF